MTEKASNPEVVDVADLLALMVDPSMVIAMRNAVAEEVDSRNRSRTCMIGKAAVGANNVEPTDSVSSEPLLLSRNIFGRKRRTKLRLIRQYEQNPASFILLDTSEDVFISPERARLLRPPSYS
jgi:hypothetical protein